MSISISYSTISDMLNLIEKLSIKSLINKNLLELLMRKDYIMEFERYTNRISLDEFTKYFNSISILKESDIDNRDLRIHHKYICHALNNIDYYKEQLQQLNNIDNNMIDTQIKIALKGLPDYISIDGLNIVLTIGIGGSFGYIYKNNIHFDFLQLIKEVSISQFMASLSHEIHHYGIQQIVKSIDFSVMSLEDLFYFHFSGEGLAVKYCNNAEGILSKAIYDSKKNIGLDKYSWDYLNSDFNNTFKRFINTIHKIRNKTISTRDSLHKEIEEYWFSPYTEEQTPSEIPNLKQTRIYSFGNEIWGVIHDCFGKEMVYKTLYDIKSFSRVYNNAVDKLGFAEYKIEY